MRFVWDHLRSVVTGRPYVHYVHESAPFEAALRRELASGAFDLVHFDSLDLQRFLPLVRHLPTVCTHHNAESVLLERRVARELGARAWYMRHQAALLARAESALLAAVRPERHGVRGRHRIAARAGPVGSLHHDPERRGYRVTSRPSGNGLRAGCVFVGGTTWFPNLDGLEWFAAEILPHMRESGMGAPVEWVGRVTDAERARFAALPGLRFTGYVDDIRPHVHAARVLHRAAARGRRHPPQDPGRLGHGDAGGGHQHCRARGSRRCTARTSCWRMMSPASCGKPPAYSRTPPWVRDSALPPAPRSSEPTAGTCWALKLRRQYHDAIARAARAGPAGDRAEPSGVRWRAGQGAAGPCAGPDPEGMGPLIGAQQCRPQLPPSAAAPTSRTSADLPRPIAASRCVRRYAAPRPCRYGAPAARCGRP